MKKFSIEIKWAALFTLVSIVWMVVEKTAGAHDQFIGNQFFYDIFFAIPAIIIYVLALQDKKQNYFNGQMDWQRGVIAGLFLSLFIAVMTPVSDYISYVMISPEYFPNMIKHVVANHSMTEAVAESNFNINSTIKRDVVNSLSYGLITAAVVALFVKTKNSKKS